MMTEALKQKLERITGRQVRQLYPLAGGKISQVSRVDFVRDEPLVAKVGDGGHDLRIEAYMLRYLRQHSGLPVPAVYHADSDLLLMDFIAGESKLNAASLRHLGQLLATCHQISGTRLRPGARHLDRASASA